MFARTPEEKAKALATVVIPTKNPGGLFHEVLRGVCCQNTDWPFEVIVIDSGSQDGTVDWIKKNHPAVELIEIPPASFGHGRTRNLGIERAKGAFVALITHDALPAHDTWLSLMVSPMIENEKIAGVFGRHLPYPQASPLVKRDITLHFDHLATWPNPIGLFDADRYARDQGYRQVLHFFSDNNSCLRKSVWEKIPYPDVNFAEDQIWAQKIIEAGYLKAFANDARVFHSHDYGVIELLRRSFDESTAFLRLFGYRLSSGKKGLLKGILKGTWSDWKYLIRLVPNNLLYFLLRAPANQIAVQVGHLLGSSPRSDRVYELLSLDHSLKTAKR